MLQETVTLLHDRDPSPLPKSSTSRVSPDVRRRVCGQRGRTEGWNIINYSNSMTSHLYCRRKNYDH